MSSSFEFGQTTQGKVIKTSELQRELKKLYKTELSFAEKLYHYTLDKAGSTLAKAAYLKDYLFGDFGLRLLLANKGENTGYWVYKGDSYFTEETSVVLREYDLKFAFNKEVCAKMWQIGEKAHKQCHDYRGSEFLKKETELFR